MFFFKCSVGITNPIKRFVQVQYLPSRTSFNTLSVFLRCILTKSHKLHNFSALQRPSPTSIHGVFF